TCIQTRREYMDKIEKHKNTTSQKLFRLDPTWTPPFLPCQHPACWLSLDRDWNHDPVPSRMVYHCLQGEHGHASSSLKRLIELTMLVRLDHALSTQLS